VLLMKNNAPWENHRIIIDLSVSPSPPAQPPTYTHTQSKCMSMHIHRQKPETKYLCWDSVFQKYIPLLFSYTVSEACRKHWTCQNPTQPTQCLRLRCPFKISKYSNWFKIGYRCLARMGSVVSYSFISDKVALKNLGYRR
jgi:hypothetical protein